MTLEAPNPSIFAQGVSNSKDQLVSADRQLTTLQQEYGGSIPGFIAIPDLLTLVQKTRRYGKTITDRIQATNGMYEVKAWIETKPTNINEEFGCIIRILDWQVGNVDNRASSDIYQRKRKINSKLARLTARLDAAQKIISVESHEKDLRVLSEAFKKSLGEPWTHFIDLVEETAAKPLHWQMLDGANCHVPGSQRTWQVQLEPLETIGAAGFTLHLTPLLPLPLHAVVKHNHECDLLRTAADGVSSALVSATIDIVAKASSIHSRLAGPIPDKYSGYAADITAAASHFQLLVTDLVQLRHTKADHLRVRLHEVDLVVLAHQASDLLRMEAQKRQIDIINVITSDRLSVFGSEHQIRQIIINLLSNAIKYSPAASKVYLRASEDNDYGCLTVADEGPGLSPEEQTRIFDKFERLGKTSLEGSGLGLYIAQRLANAMSGSISIKSAPGQGARFTLSVPLANKKKALHTS